jgi:hypothetical protein
MLMKLRVLLLTVIGLVAGGTSYAFADDGHGNHHPAGADACQKAHLVGTVAAPQILTVTVMNSGADSPFPSGQTVTVTLGSGGQTLRVNVEGCGAGSSLSATEAELHAWSGPSGHGAGGGHGGGDHHQSTTQAAVTTQLTTTTHGTTHGSTASTNTTTTTAH